MIRCRLCLREWDGEEDGWSYRWDKRHTNRPVQYQCPFHEQLRLFYD